MPRDTVEYEWAMQELDYYEGCNPNYPDIVETWYCSGYGYGRDRITAIEEAMRMHFRHAGDSQVVLIRTMGNDEDGVTDRTEAVVAFEGFGGTAEGWILPEKFDDRTKVPAKFHKQIKGWSMKFEKKRNTPGGLNDMQFAMKPHSLNLHR